METPAKTMLRVGAWRVNPTTGEIWRDGETQRLEARALLLLLCLAEHSGEVVSIEELLSRAWSGVIVSPDSVYQAVASLRRQLGDDPKQPSYIATVPRLGYRMVAKVMPWMDGAAEASGSKASGSEIAATDKFAKPNRREKIRAKWAVVAVVVVGVAIVGTLAFLVRSRAAGNLTASQVASQDQKSIAVLPFLDLTDGMKEEEFADGITEELIDKLSKIPDFRVPAATASFYFKGKQAALEEIARRLGVVYVLDGSVRKSAARFRVAARLVRAENGYVIWSETYDRPLVDKLLVQEDIAGEVAKALRASIESSPEREKAR
jgi:TolB-like protein/DNA-binding winged helix-turn-helix (wHTH) protein